MLLAQQIPDMSLCGWMRLMRCYSKPWQGEKSAQKCLCQTNEAHAYDICDAEFSRENTWDNSLLAAPFHSSKHTAYSSPNVEMATQTWRKVFLSQNWQQPRAKGYPNSIDSGLGAFECFNDYHLAKGWFGDSLPYSLVRRFLGPDLPDYWDYSSGLNQSTMITQAETKVGYARNSAGSTDFLLSTWKSSPCWLPSWYTLPWHHCLSFNIRSPDWSPHDCDGIWLHVLDQARPFLCRRFVLKAHFRDVHHSKTISLIDFSP